MNQRSSIEFELTQSSEGKVPLPEGPGADETVIASGSDAFPPPNSGQGNHSNDKKGEDSSDPSDALLDAQSTEVSQSDSSLGLADKPLLAGEENTVISSPVSAQAEQAVISDRASAEKLQAQLFGHRDDRSGSDEVVVIDNMEVFEKIGAGGMGAVFRAVDVELAREVALKVLHPRTSADPSLVARFRNEARACAQLNHDNIARVFSADNYEGVHYIAYEYAAGKTIKELIHERGVLSTEETVNFAIQATLALSHIEAAGITHRDIKPSNIILTHSGKIKVVDLGLARRDTEDSIADLTVDGTTLGTFDYLAPEQARDPRSADIRSDIYSLGCSIYHMLTGKPPYPNGTAMQKMLDHQGKDPPDVRELNRSVPAPLADIVRQMMMTQPDDRYQAPGQLLADLIRLAGKLQLRSVPAEGIVWRRVPVRRMRDIFGSMILAITVALICVTALVMHFMPSGIQLDGTSGSAKEWLFAGSDPVTANDGQNTDSNNQEEIPIASAKQSDAPETSQGGEIQPNKNSTTPESAELGATVPETAPANGDVVTETELALFVIQRSGGTTSSFDTLRQAWDNARNGDIIELDFDGPSPTVTTPLPRRAVTDSPRIQLRAVRDKRPVLVFGIDPDDQISTAKDRFFEFSNNLQVDIKGVHFQVDLSEATQFDVDDWSLFDFRGENHVVMEDCTVDVINPEEFVFSLFRLKDSSANDGTLQPSSIRLENIAVRGCCDAICVQAQADCDVTVNKSGFALDGSILRNLGSSRMVSQSNLNLNMTHCTSILAQPFLTMLDSDLLNAEAPDRVLPTVHVDSQSNVFASLSSGGTLVEMQGNQYQGDLQDLLYWNGKSSYFNHIGIFWKIESGLGEGAPIELDLDSWQSTWNRKRDCQETFPQVFASDVWNAPQLLVDRSPVDLRDLPVTAFELNPAYFSNSNGTQFSLDASERNPGVVVYDLPRFPRAPETPRISPPSGSISAGGNSVSE